LTVDYISDLHVDFHVKYNNSPTKRRRLIKEYVQALLPKTPSATLIIAGDISHYNTMSIELIKEFKNTYSNIMATYGNHDMYMTSNAQRTKYQASYIKIEELKESLKEIGVYLLDGDVVEIDGVVYGGLCGWYNLPTRQDKDYWRFFMNDSNYIYSGVEYKMPYSYGRVRAEWETQTFYEEQLELLKSFSNIDVLVSHVCQVLPPNEVIAEAFRDTASNIFYYVDNMDLVKATGCRYYIYGHTHDKQEWQQQSIKFRANPYGYPRESVGRKIKTLELTLS